MLREALAQMPTEHRLLLQDAFDNVEPYIVKLKGNKSFIAVHSPTMPEGYKVTEEIGYYSYGVIHD